MVRTMARCAPWKLTTQGRHMRLSELHGARRGPRSVILATAVSILLGATTGAHADELAELRQRLDTQEQQIKALERRLQEQDAAGGNAASARLEEQEQQIKVLERKLELGQEADATAVKSTPVVKAAPSGFALQSADGK